MIRLLRMITRLLHSAVVLLSLSSAFAQSGEKLGDVLRAANVPTAAFSSAELSGKITSYAASDGDPFLLAYYDDNGSGELQGPLRVIRYARGGADVRRSAVRETSAVFEDSIETDCLGSVLQVLEREGLVFIDTHLNPSAGCVIVLSPNLELKTAVSGWILGFMGPDYAIFRRSEVHFMSVHPMRIVALDLKQNRAIDLYPYPGDSQRTRFSAAIEPLITGTWCTEYNAQCNPSNFDVELQGELFINQRERVVGFQARFDAAGFGPAAEKRVPPRTVSYVFREREGRWEHREFGPGELERTAGRVSFAELIQSKPDLAFQATRNR